MIYKNSGIQGLLTIDIKRHIIKLIFIKYIYILFALIPIFINAQSFPDTIFKKDNKIICCKITLVNNDNIFYNDKKSDGQFISLSLISKYSQNGKYKEANYKPTILIPDSAASINGILLRQLKVDYIQILGYSKILSNKINIQVDYGQGNNIWDGTDTRLVSGNGKIMTLNSMIDALNFFSINGFEFVQAYAFSVNGENVYHYLLRKNQKK